MIFIDNHSSSSTNRSGRMTRIVEERVPVDCFLLGAVAIDQQFQQNQKTGMAQLLNHPSTFFRAATACLCTSFAMVNIVPFTFLSTCIAYVSTQAAQLFCKLAVHRHQCCRCPTNTSTLSVHLHTACHHLDILFFEVRCGTEFTGFSAPHAGIYAALPFCILKCSCSRHLC